MDVNLVQASQKYGFKLMVKRVVGPDGADFMLPQTEEYWRHLTNLVEQHGVDEELFISNCWEFAEAWQSPYSFGDNFPRIVEYAIYAGCELFFRKRHLPHANENIACPLARLLVPVVTASIKETHQS